MINHPVCRGRTDGRDRLDVDILIGGNVYWKFVTHEAIEAEHGPVAVKTKLGLVLSGEMIEKSNMPVNFASTQSLLKVQVMSAGIKTFEEKLD